MGFFDSLSEMFEAALPWSTVEAEAEAEDESEEKTEEEGGEEKEEAAEEEAPEEEEGGEEEEEEEEEEELVDPKETLEEACKKSPMCAPSKHHYEACVDRVLEASESGEKHATEDCVEEFFHLAHCASSCAAPKLWQQLK